MSTTSTPETTSPESPWTLFITPFAAAISATPEDATEKLRSLVGEPGDDAKAILQSEEFSPFEDLKGIFTDVPVAKLRMAVATHLRRKEESRTVAAPAVAYGLLPKPDDDPSFLEALKTGGILKVEQSTVIAGIRAALAEQSDLYSVPKLLVGEMERFAAETDEVFGPNYYAIQKSLTEQRYGDLFAALGVPGSYFSQKKKDLLLDRLNADVWRLLSGFQTQLAAWYDEARESVMDPANLIAALGGGRGAVASGLGVSEIPPTDALRAAAETVIAGLNKIFAGTGPAVAAALAADAIRIREIIMNPDLPGFVGAPNREMMLKKINREVSSQFVNLEQSLAQYALCIMKLPSITPGPEETQYLGAMYQLGRKIDFDVLSRPRARREVDSDSLTRRA